MNIVFQDINSSAHYETGVKEEPRYIVKLDNHWMEKRGELAFKKALERTIRKLESNNHDTIIMQEQIIMNYSEKSFASTYISKEYLMNLFKDKPSYILVLLSFCLTCICFIGKTFLYGYYFSSSIKDFSGLLSLVVNPIPIDIFSSALVGVNVIINVIVMYCALAYSVNRKLSLLHRFMGITLTVVVLSIISLVLFSSIEGKSMELTIILVSIHTLIPITIFAMINMLFNFLDRPFLSICSFIICVFIAVLLVDHLELNFLDYNFGSDVLTLLVLPSSQVIHAIFDKFIKNRKSPLYQRKTEKKAESENAPKSIAYQDLQTSIQITTIFTTFIFTVIILFFLTLTYGAGSLYSSFPYNNQYSMITYTEAGDAQSTTILGTIVGEKNNTYYVSSYKDKALVTIKDTEVYSRSCKSLQNYSSENQFETDVEMFKNEVIGENELECKIEYIPSSNGIMSFHRITSNRNDYKVKVYYQELPTREVGKILIQIIHQPSEDKQNNEIDVIRDFYLKYFKLFDYSDNDEYYFLNGTLQITEKQVEDLIIDQYVFETNEF